MHLSGSRLLLVAVPAVAASMAVLAFGAVGRSAWIVQVLAICLACALALAGARRSRRNSIRFRPRLILVITLLGIAVPLLSEAPGPERWASLGPINLYVAPVLLPSFLVACSAWIAGRGRLEHFAFAAIVGASGLLAAQPDGSQALALLAAAAVAFARSRSTSPVSIVALALAALITAWAFSQPDPLQAVAHVEGVFALALGRSLIAGVAVIGSAAALVVGLHVSSSGGRTWLSAIAAYYAALFACSVAGLTPAPMIGYGAGPWLGFGLMVAVASALDPEVSPGNSSSGTSHRGAASATWRAKEEVARRVWWTPRAVLVSGLCVNDPSPGLGMTQDAGVIPSEVEGSRSWCQRKILLRRPSPYPLPASGER